MIFVGIIIIGVAAINLILYSIYEAELFGPHQVQKSDIMIFGFVVSVAHTIFTILIMRLVKKTRIAMLLTKDEETKLQDISTAKDEFAAMVAHELKTPLVPIVSYAQMLLQDVFGELNETQKTKLGTILTCAESAQRIVTDMLDINKAELKQLKLHSEFVDIKKVIEEAISLMSSTAALHRVLLQSQGLKSFRIDIDRIRILQVLTNLIRNAIDFVPQDTGLVKIGMELQSRHIEIYVTDNGSGIPKEQIPNLFKKFYQMDTSSTRNRGGTGLGLAICRSIVELHGGEIWAESQLGRGTSMKIVLPITTRL